MDSIDLNGPIGGNSIDIVINIFDSTDDKNKDIVTINTMMNAYNNYNNYEMNSNAFH